MKTTHPPNPPSHSFQPVMVDPQSPQTPPTRPQIVGHAGWPSAKHHANCIRARTRLLQTRTSYSHPQDDTSLATMMTYFVEALQTAPFHRQWWTVAALREWVRPMTRVDARAVPPTKSSYSPEARSWQQLKSQSTLSKFGTLQNSCISRPASPQTCC